MLEYGGNADGAKGITRRIDDQNDVCGRTIAVIDIAKKNLLFYFNAVNKFLRTSESNDLIIILLR